MTSDPSDKLVVTVRPASESDAAAIAAIYNPYVTDTIITFEEEPVSAQEMASRLSKLNEAGLPWIVAEAAGRIVGYAYAGPWRPRAAYRHSVETTVYVDKDLGHRGIGARLYDSLLSALRARGVHAALGGIALPNAPSVALHERFGFVKVGHLREVGFKLGQWVDVGYWQILLDSEGAG